MKKSAYLDIRKFILKRLLDERCISQHQLTLGTVCKFIPEEYGRDKKLAKQVAMKMISEGLLLSKRKHYDFQIWLNRERLDEIRKIVMERQEGDSNS